ncbi:PREDICTED: uncharacterized protein LOC109173079 [Ipomoea nil]|uniref:uncharacterized protein LOC109173079 n=1 Tax=Ipomoea nil TaxID=35883 RepID=UPI0009009E29|nr:PREDICTED: uncharacterized protein LOC109173079 [Ipomoea nil]
MWKPESGFELIALNNDYFLAKFDSLADYEAAKYQGPWMVFDHYLITLEWRPNFDTRKGAVDKVLAWLRFPSLLIEYFDEDFLKKIGKNIGRPVKIDTATDFVSKGKFARVCVELDISKPLLPMFVIEGVEWPIEYEGIHQICFKCGTYGHRIEQCGVNEAGESTSVNGASEAPPVPAPIQKPKERYGAWMLVTRKDRRRQNRTPFQPGSGVGRPRTHSTPGNTNEPVHLGSPSRFAALQNEDELMGENQGDLPRAPDVHQSVNLPRIRTNYRGGHQGSGRRPTEGDRTINHPPPTPQAPPPTRETTRGRGVYHEDIQTDAPVLVDHGDSLEHVPPDINLAEPVMGEPPDIDMQDGVGRSDHSGFVADSRQGL